MMRPLDVLQNEYSGDEAWARFAASVQPFSDPGGVAELTPLVGDEQIASVLSAQVATGARWLSTALPALEGRTPASVLLEHPQGLKIVRTLLMRMP